MSSTTPFASKAINGTSKNSVTEPESVEFALEDVNLNDSEPPKTNHLQQNPIFVRETMSRKTPPMKAEDASPQSNNNKPSNKQAGRKCLKRLCFPCNKLKQMCSKEGYCCCSRRRRPEDQQPANHDRKQRADSDSVNLDAFAWFYYCHAVKHDNSESSAGCVTPCTDCCGRIGQCLESLTHNCCQKCGDCMDWITSRFGTCLAGTGDCCSILCLRMEDRFTCNNISDSCCDTSGPSCSCCSCCCNDQSSHDSSSDCDCDCDLD